MNKPAIPASEKSFLKIAGGIPLLRIDQSFPPFLGKRYKRPDFLAVVNGKLLFVEAKSGNNIGTLSGEEYHRLLNLSLLFGIPVVVVWDTSPPMWSPIDKPIKNNGVVALAVYPLLSLSDMVKRIQEEQLPARWKEWKDKEGEDTSGDTSAFLGSLPKKQE